MPTRSRGASKIHKAVRIAASIGLIAALVALGASPRQAQRALGQDGRFVCLEFDTELTSLELSGGPFPMPLASDPANNLGDSVDGYGFVDSTVTVTLSSQRDPNPGPASTGRAFANPGEIDQKNGTECPEEIDPDALDGQNFFVDSFFDVFFDITVTDVDDRPGRDFAGMPDGASIQLQDNGPAGLSTFYDRMFEKDKPNFGLIPPPEVRPYIGHFQIEIPLGGDINGNGENDKIKFTLATHSVLDANRTFIELPDGTTQDTFDSAAVLEGAIVDESTDPPFTIGATLPSGLPDPAVFGGPTTATSDLLTPIVKPDFAYVDANDDGEFDVADGDVALTQGEVDDGVFDTKKTEGGYTERLKGAGLVINGNPITAEKKIKFAADGKLTVNTDLSAPKSVTLKSRTGDVNLDDPTIESLKIVIKAADSIVGTGDVIRASGPKSKVTLKADTTINVSNTHLSAGKSISAKTKAGDIIATGAVLRGCLNGKIKLQAMGPVDVSEAVARAYRAISVKSKTADVNAAGSSIATVDGSTKGSVKITGGQILVGAATILAPKKVTLKGTQVGTPAQMGEGTLPCFLPVPAK